MKERQGARRHADQARPRPVAATPGRALRDPPGRLRPGGDLRRALRRPPGLPPLAAPPPARHLRAVVRPAARPAAAGGGGAEFRFEAEDDPYTFARLRIP